MQAWEAKSVISGASDLVKQFEAEICERQRQVEILKAKIRNEKQRVKAWEQPTQSEMQSSQGAIQVPPGSQYGDDSIMDLESIKPIRVF